MDNKENDISELSKEDFEDIYFKLYEPIFQTMGRIEKEPQSFGKLAKFFNVPLQSIMREYSLLKKFGLIEERIILSKKGRTFIKLFRKKFGECLQKK